MSALSESTLNDLSAIVGKNYCFDDAARRDTYGKDWTRGFTVNAGPVVVPGSRDEVVALLSYCNKKKLAVIPSGGRTGLAAAAIATNGEVVLSLERLAKIHHVDTVGLSIDVDAGVRTQTVQEAAKKEGLFFGLDLASKGSCQIGGNIATNAGGTKLIRFGGMREQVLGMEVVLADGRILDMNTALRKNNTGYDLKQLFIGSEGTLGIITRATLKLIPPPKELRVMCMAVDSFEKIPRLMRVVNKLGVQPTAFEFFTKESLRLVLRFHTDLRAPFGSESNFYVLLETEKDPDGATTDTFETLCEKGFDENLIDDAVIASSSQEFHSLWGLRENISESISQYGHVRKNDISLPIDKLDPFVEEANQVVAAAPKDIELVLFGHIGDGNLHINYIAPKTLDPQTFKDMAYDVERKIFALLPRYKGSISAEHGIGMLKKSDLPLCRSGAEIEIMRQMKKIFDPNGILNPGKIFDL